MVAHYTCQRSMLVKFSVTSIGMSLREHCGGVLGELLSTAAAVARSRASSRHRARSRSTTSERYQGAVLSNATARLVAFLMRPTALLERMPFIALDGPDMVFIGVAG